MNSTLQLHSPAVLPVATERDLRAHAGAAVLWCARKVLDGVEGKAFLLARTAQEVAALPTCPEKPLLERLVLRLLDPASADGAIQVAYALVDYACEMERTRRLPAANDALELARAAAPDDAEIALHAGRVARLMTDSGRALQLYRTAQELDRTNGMIARLARIGVAAVSPDPERQLGRAIRTALREGDAEAAAVGLEERARVRRSHGSWQAAARDLCLAALRYPDAVDRARVAHELSDVLVSRGHVSSAREALQVALTAGDAPQRDHARTRLHTLARDVGDEIGMRRWRSFSRPSLVSLSLYGHVARGDTSLAPRIRRWRDRLES